MLFRQSKYNSWNLGKQTQIGTYVQDQRFPRWWKNSEHQWMQPAQGKIKVIPSIQRISRKTHWGMMYNHIWNVNSQRKVKILNCEMTQWRFAGPKILLLYTKVCKHLEGNIKGSGGCRLYGVTLFVKILVSVYLWLVQTFLFVYNMQIKMVCLGFFSLREKSQVHKNTETFYEGY